MTSEHRFAIERCKCHVCGEILTFTQEQAKSWSTPYVICPNDGSQYVLKFTGDPDGSVEINRVYLEEIE